VEQRELLGEQIQLYRYATLAWCLHAVVAANPRINLGRTTERSRGPAEELRYRLTRSIKASNAGLPPLNELTTPQEFSMVELASGRQGRRTRRTRLRRPHGPRPTVDRTVHDRVGGRCEVTRALVVLDKRYEAIPEWIPIRERGQLDRAAQVCGVLQAEHNMLVHLASFPNALNLRRVMDGQRILSHEAARRAPNVAPELIEKWLEREQTYKKLIDETRDVGGGRLAAAEVANAVGRLRDVHVDEITTPEPLRDLDKLFTRTDARVAAIIEQGIIDRLYFISVKVPRIVDASGELVSPVRERHVPITAPINTDLLAITRRELRPACVAAVPRPAPQRAGRSSRSRLTTSPNAVGGAAASRHGHEISVQAVRRSAFNCRIGQGRIGPWRLSSGRRCSCSTCRSTL
jgi:hypothetical protein